MEKNKMMKNRKKVDFRELFSNNRFVLLFSIVLAFVIWTAISMTASPEETFLIKDVPVDFSLRGVCRSSWACRRLETLILK